MPRKQILKPREDPQLQFIAIPAIAESRPETPPLLTFPSMALPVARSPGGDSMRIMSDDSSEVQNVLQTPGGILRLAGIDRDLSEVSNRIDGQTRKRKLSSPNPVPSSSRPDTSVPAPPIDPPNAPENNEDEIFCVEDEDFSANDDEDWYDEHELNDEAIGDSDSGSEVDSDDDVLLPLDSIYAMEGMDAEDQPDQAREDVELSDQYNWSDDYATFAGQKEVFRAEAGPSTDAMTPYDIFIKIWDKPTMEYIVQETNNYAWTTIAKKCEFDGGLPPSSRANAWKEVTVAELYKFFGVNIIMSIDPRSDLSEYWTTDITGMPKFRALMSRNRFCLILQYLHFCNNDYVEHGTQRKLAKIKPLLDILNQKFSELYTPHQNISIDESLLLWKGRLSWKQCIRTKAARFGIKKYELCESDTGYLYRFIVYTGKGSVDEAGPIHGFTSATSKVVLKLMAGLFDKGYCLFMDNFYNTIPLTRFLKSRGTDVVGTLNRRQLDVPEPIKRLQDNNIPRGDRISRHCGDMSIVAWKDVKLVTMVSTYHPDNMEIGRRAGVNILKPVVVSDYNAFMGGVDSKDQQLSMYPLERKRGHKWYVKVIRHLLNASVLNCLVVHRHNNPERITHRKFRFQLAKQLINLDRPDGPIVGGQAGAIRAEDRLDGNGHGNHFLGKLPKTIGKNRQIFRNCVRCAVRNIRKQVSSYCKKCEVPLCPYQCFEDYHTLRNLQ